MQRRQLPDRVPSDWQITADGEKDVLVTVPGKLHALIEDMRGSRVTSAGQVPTGFDPDRLYQSRSHPRGLALTIFGASDAVRSLGIDWDVLRQTVQPDQFAVYSGSAMGQLDVDGTGGMMQAGADGQARHVEAAAARFVRDAGGLHQRVRARQPRCHRRDDRRLCDVPLQPPPGCGGHSERSPSRRDGRQLRSADHAGDHRRLSHDGCARRRRSTDGSSTAAPTPRTTVAPAGRSPTTAASRCPKPPCTPC